MFNIYKYRDFPGDDERIIAEAENSLEERFILWFAQEREIPMERIHQHDVLVFDPMNSIEQIKETLQTAYREFKVIFNYSQVPDVIGLSFIEAEEKINASGLLWVIHAQSPSDKYPRGTVIWQSPSQGVTSAPYNPIKLVLSSGIVEHKENKKPERIEDDEVFKQFLS